MQTTQEEEKIIQPKIAKDFCDYLQLTSNYESKPLLIIDQQHGIGDILFCLTLARMIMKMYRRKVCWHVLNHFSWIQYYVRDITFLPQTDFDSAMSRKAYGISSRKEFGAGGFYDYIPLAYSNEVCNVPYHDVMKSKYWLFGMDWRFWKNYFYFERDLDREADLKEFLHIREGERYNLISQHFRSNFSGFVEINPDNGLRNIHMQPIKGFTLLDWCGVIETASNIHAVGSSINYLIETLPVKSESVHLYLRKPDETNFDNYSFILEKDFYVLHG